MDSQRGVPFPDSVSQRATFLLGDNISDIGQTSTESSPWNNNSTTEAPGTPDNCNYGLFKLTLYACIMGTVCLVGFCGNIVSFVVLRKDGSSPTASLQLQALAVADNFLLVFWANHFIIGYTFQYANISFVDLPRWVRYIRVYAYPFLFISQTETIWLTVMIAVNRYIVVWTPLRARVLCTLNRTRLQVLAVTVFSIAYNLPRFFDIAVAPEYVTVTYNVTVNGSWKTTSEQEKQSTYHEITDFGLNHAYRFVYMDILYQILTFVLPLVLLAFFNTSVMIAYYRAFKLRQRLVGSTETRHEHNENNLTLLMIVVVLLFMVCQAPARIVQQVWKYQTQTCSPENYISHFSSTLEAINSSVNFVVYFTFRKRFRRILQRSCYCCRSQSDLLRITSRTSANFVPAAATNARKGSTSASAPASRNSSRVDTFNHHHRNYHHYYEPQTTTTGLDEEDSETTRLNQTGV